MKFHLFRKIIIIAAITVLVLTASGCSKKSEKPEQSSGNKPPEVLGKIEQNIDSIIDLLDKEGKIQVGTGAQQGQQKRESSNVQQSQSSQQGQGGQSGQGQQGQGQGQSQSQQQGQGQQQTGQSSQQSNPWDQGDQTVKQLHLQWSQLQPEAVKAGVSPQTVDSFDSDLNTLTNDIAVKNLMTTLNDANNLYKYIPEFLSHYKDKSVDLKRLKYYVRDVMYKSRFDKWDAAAASVVSAKNLMPNLRSQQSDENKTKYQSLEYSVNDLQKVVNQQQKSLTQIKANVVLDNIKSVEQSSSSQQSGGQSGNQSGGGQSGSQSGGQSGGGQSQ